MLAGLLRTMRPHQWVKNLFVLAPLVFAKELFELNHELRSMAGFAAFCLLASSVYIFNDIVDVDADRAHAVKKTRPIASGKVSETAARTAFLALVIGAITIGMLLNVRVVGCLVSYLGLNVLYSMRLKHVAYVDVFCIAAGFELRVLAGAFAAEVPASAYLLVVTFLLALFLGFGKRMHELSQREEAHEQRAALKAYSKTTLTVLLYVTALATIATYVVYTLDKSTRHAFQTNYLVISAVFAIFGVLRFLHLVRGRPHAESPTEEMLRDKPFLANLVLWAIAVVVIIYTTRFS